MLPLLILLPLPFKTIMVHTWYVPCTFPHVSLWFPIGNHQVSMPRNHGNRGLGCFLSEKSHIWNLRIFELETMGKHVGSLCLFILTLGWRLTHNFFGKKTNTIPWLNDIDNKKVRIFLHDCIHLLVLVNIFNADVLLPWITVLCRVNRW